VLSVFSREIYLANYPVLGYQEALDLQRLVVSTKLEREFPDTLLLLEHPPVITLGRRGKEEHIRVPERILHQERIELFRVERGGDITYHGPGQIVGYPIFDLSNHGKDLGRFVFSIEEVLIRVCQDLGIQAVRNPINRGVWLGERKIASIGLAVRKWISFHGFAFNSAPNMAHFRLITPCGLSGVEMTSVTETLGKNVDGERLRKRICHHFEEVFEIRLCKVDIQEKLDQTSHKTIQATSQP
jgi:lipoate-protein ligase B